MIYAELGLAAPPIEAGHPERAGAARERRRAAPDDRRRRHPRRAAQPRPAARAQLLAAGIRRHARGARRFGPRDRRRRGRQRVRRRGRRAAPAPDHRARLPRPDGQPRVGRLGPQRQPRHVLPPPADRVAARRGLRAGHARAGLSSGSADRLSAPGGGGIVARPCVACSSSVCCSAAALSAPSRAAKCARVSCHAGTAIITQGALRVFGLPFRASAEGVFRGTSVYACLPGGAAVQLGAGRSRRGDRLDDDRSGSHSTARATWRRARPTTARAAPGSRSGSPTCAPPAAERSPTASAASPRRRRSGCCSAEHC